MKKYVIFGYSDYTEAMFLDLKYLENVCYFEYKPKTSFQFIVDYIVKKQRLVTRLPFFLKKYLFKKYYDSGFISNNDYVVFVFFELSPLANNIEFTHHLKRIYPNAKTIFYYLNTLPEIADWSVGKVNKTKCLYDITLSFDEIDANNYGLLHFDLFMSKPHYDLKITNNKKIFFCGQNKDRLNYLNRIHKVLISNLVDCDFSIYIGGDNKNKLEERVFLDFDTKEYDGICFFDSWQPYSTILQETAKSNCILELVKDTKHSGCTLRTLEAIVLKKKLLTNNRFLVDKSFFNSKQMHVFDCPENIDVSFIKSEIDEYDFVNPEVVSPVFFVKYIESILDGNYNSRN